MEFFSNIKSFFICTVCSLQSVFLHDRNFHGGFWQYMANRHNGPWGALRFRNRGQSFQRSLLVLWNLDYILSQNNYIPFCTMEILVHNMKGQFQIVYPVYNIARLKLLSLLGFLPCLLWEINPTCFGIFRSYYLTIIAISHR